MWGVAKVNGDLKIWKKNTDVYVPNSTHWPEGQYPHRGQWAELSYPPHLCSHSHLRQDYCTVCCLSSVSKLDTTATLASVLNCRFAILPSCLTTGNMFAVEVYLQIPQRAVQCGDWAYTWLWLWTGRLDGAQCWEDSSTLLSPNFHICKNRANVPMSGCEDEIRLALWHARTFNKG